MRITSALLRRERFSPAGAAAGTLVLVLGRPDGPVGEGWLKFVWLRPIKPQEACSTALGTDLEDGEHEQEGQTRSVGPAWLDRINGRQPFSTVWGQTPIPG